MDVCQLNYFTVFCFLLQIDGSLKSRKDAAIILESLDRTGIKLVGDRAMAAYRQLLECWPSGDYDAIAEACADPYRYIDVDMSRYDHGSLFRAGMKVRPLVCSI